MRGMISRSCPPRESVLEALERAMVVALARANAARAAGDTSGVAYWTSRLTWLATRAAEYLTETAA